MSITHPDTLTGPAGNESWLVVLNRHLTDHGTDRLSQAHTTMQSWDAWDRLHPTDGWKENHSITEFPEHVFQLREYKMLWLPGGGMLFAWPPVSETRPGSMVCPRCIGIGKVLIPEHPTERPATCSECVGAGRVDRPDRVAEHQAAETMRGVLDEFDTGVRDDEPPVF